MPRRTRWTALAAAVVVLPLTACSTGTTDGASRASATASADPDAFPVTIDHAFGSTTIEQAPTRVATVSWVNADVALALGVVPVGMAKDEWGGNANGSTPWKDAALDRLGAPIGGDAAPAQYSEADGINYTEIAKTSPDVILAAYSGLTKAEYDQALQDRAGRRLPRGRLRHVLAGLHRAGRRGARQGGRGRGAGRADRADHRDGGREVPPARGQDLHLRQPRAGLRRRRQRLHRGRQPPALPRRARHGPRPPVVETNTKDTSEFFIPWSAERADELEADVFVTWVPDEKTVAQIEKDPLLGQIPAVKRGSWVADSDNTLTLSVSASSPLSLPWALDRFLPMLGAAADKA